MYDPKFEKAVRQRMEELEFPPAESVWANIEKAMVVPRRERRGAFLWRFLAPGLVVAASVGFYVYHHSATMAPVSKPVSAQVVKAGPAAQNAAGAARNAAGAGQKMAGATQRTPASGQSVLAPGDKLVIHGQPIRMKAQERSDAAERKAAEGGSTEDRAASVANRSASVAARSTSVSPRSANIVAQSSAIAPWLYMPGLADQRSVLNIGASSPDRQKGLISLASLSKPRHPWEAGFVAGGGLSRLNRLNANYASQALSPQAFNFYIVSGSSTSKNYISDIRPDASFDGGIYLQKALSARWGLNTGMNLHYYSTRIHIGQQLNAYTAQSLSSFLTAPVTVTAQGAALYSPGDQRVYTNRYYFLELPVAVQWKINRSPILPVFLQGGVSLARLMSANALYYNEQTGVYSKDGSMVNKTQVNIGSALLVGLPFRGIRIQAGPEVQYGVTPLVSNRSLGDQHTLYTGLRLVVMPITERR